MADVPNPPDLQGGHTGSVARVMELGGAIVIECAHPLTDGQRAHLEARTRHAWPESPVVILDPGMRVVTGNDEVMQRLDAIEARLNILITAIAVDADGDDEDLTANLDDDTTTRARAPHVPL